MPRPKLRLYGVIGDAFDALTAKDVAEQLDEMEDAEEIAIALNSGGGFVEDGLAIYNLLKQHPAKKTISVDGVAASMASIIAMAGDEIIMRDGALMMIHMPWNVTIGNASVHRKQAETLDKIAEQMRDIYATRSGMEPKAVWKAMEAETWYSGEDAVGLGLASRIDEKAKARIERVSFSHLALTNVPPVIRAAQENRMAAAVRDHPAATAAAATESEMTTEQTVSAASPPVADPPQATVVDIHALQARAVADERARASEIRRMVAAVKLPADMATKLVDAGTPVDEARAAIIDHMAAEQERTQGNITSFPNVVGGACETEKYRAQAKEWLLHRTNNRGEDGKPINLTGNMLRGMTLAELAADCLARAGGNPRGMDKMTMVGQSITQTTSDFPIILQDSLNGVLLGQYRIAPDTWRRFTAIGSVSDFRPSYRVRGGTMQNLDLVPEATEYKNRAIPDAEQESIRAVTKGNIVNLSRQAIVNDDLGFFTRIAGLMGRAAARTIEADVYATLALNSGLGPTMADGLTLFHADHANIASAAAPSVTSIDAARQQLAVQTDVSGLDFLDIRPDIWLGPLALGTAVRLLNTAEFDYTASAASTTPNVVRSTFREVIDTPRLSGTAWYVFADPQDEPTLEVVFLNGAQEPFLDQHEPWTVDGMAWKVRLDYGVGAVGWRGAIRNAGS